MRDGAKTTFARHLRRDMTEAELRLWHHLRRRQVLGHRFRRQVPVGPYVADFACVEARLIIEIDGAQHLDCPRDAQRDGWLAEQDYVVLRFWNHDVSHRTEGVLMAIHDWFASATCPHPNLPPQAGEGEKESDLSSQAGEGVLR